MSWELGAGSKRGNREKGDYIHLTPLSQCPYHKGINIISFIGKAFLFDMQIATAKDPSAGGKGRNYRRGVGAAPGYRPGFWFQKTDRLIQALCEL